MSTAFAPSSTEAVGFIVNHLADERHFSVGCDISRIARHRKYELQGGGGLRRLPERCCRYRRYSQTLESVRRCFTPVASRIAGGRSSAGGRYGLLDEAAAAGRLDCRT